MNKKEKLILSLVSLGLFILVAFIIGFNTKATSISEPIKKFEKNFQEVESKKISIEKIDKKNIEKFKDNVNFKPDKNLMRLKMVSKASMGVGFVVGVVNDVLDDMCFQRMFETSAIRSMGKLLGEAIRRNDYVLIKNMDKFTKDVNANTILNKQLDSFEKFVLNNKKHEEKIDFKTKNIKVSKNEFKNFYERFLEEKMDNPKSQNIKILDEFKNYLRKKEGI